MSETTTKPIATNRAIGSGSKVRQQTPTEVREELMLQEDARQKARESSER